MTIFHRWKQTALHNKALVWTSFLVAFGTIFYAVAAACQIQLMKESSKQSAAQLDRLVGGINESIQRSVKQSGDATDTSIRNNRESLDAALAQNRAELKASIAQGKEALDASIQGLKSTQRAFVTFGQSPLARPNASLSDASVAESHEFQITLENSGATPAKNARHYFSFSTFIGPMPDNFDFGNVGQTVITPFLIGPRQTITGGSLAVSQDSLTNVKGHRVHLYFWGWVTYHDVFPETPEHVTMFCEELTDVYGDPVKTTPFLIGYSSCLRHNCSDDNCDGERGDPRRYN